MMRQTGDLSEGIWQDLKKQVVPAIA